MAKSSINIKMAELISFLHNVREAIVAYLIDTPDRNECDRSANEAHEYYIGLLREATANYTARTKQKIQTNPAKFIWESVVNLNFDHELKDLQNLAKVLEEKYGWQPMQCAVHRDEGHIDKETGEKVYNYHGHIVFFMLNKDGLYTFKKQNFGIKKMQELQTLVAEKLGMERGIPKSISKRVRLEHNQYRQVAKAQEKEKNKFNLLQSMYDLLSSKLTRVSTNKKKTARKVRKFIQKSKQNNTLNKIKQFCVKSMDTVFNDLSRYPLLNSLNFMEDSFIFQWLEAAKAEILSLRAENEMMRDRIINFDEENHPLVDKVYHEDDASIEDNMDLPQLEEVYTPLSSIEKLREVKEYKSNIEIEDEYSEMADFYFDIDLEDEYEEKDEDERLHDVVPVNLSDNEGIEEKNIEMTDSESEDESDEKEDGSEDHVVVVSAAEFELELDEELSMLNIDTGSDPLLEFNSVNLETKTDVKKEKKEVNKIKFKH